MSEDYNLGFDAGYDCAICREVRDKEYKNRQIKRKREAEIERKLYFAGQKLLGIFVLLFTFVSVALMNGDATLALITAPLGCVLIFSKRRLLTVKQEGEDEWL
ncbi:MAG: hypothetical protein LUE29_09650 [Lachnospiraceae bacterium]|nr:hypothetical protein [Lachnospiraceae bacterium]